MKRPLGKTGIELSPIGFGCASIWGNNLITDDDAAALFEKAYALGITYFDTGHSYGRAEERIGMALRRGTVDRKDIVLSTKFGTRIIDGKTVHDVSPAWICESVETSLRRMQTDYLDLLSIHGTRHSDFCPAVFDTLDALKREGVVRAVGASISNDAGLLDEIGRNDWFDYVFIRYNILNQALEPAMAKLHAQGVGIIAGAPLAEGLYSADIFRIRSKKDVWYLARAAAHFRRQLRQGCKFRFLETVDGMSGAQAALRYVLDNPAVTSAVVGTTSVEHLLADVQTLNMTLPPQVRQKIQNVKL